ncbi:Ig-like domain-containing protein [uncultured Methanobrevibacter sp.]|uniref:Ig-like domain-containing protein n=1 Tax=uncultured Methanobrevibacter sp. TaxID=253161 RepID=UPI00261167D1|nr:Ig-like domain-containing protein [uncultured Methanobrevibacter sp.]
MIRKISMIGFIFLFIFLTGTVCATTAENETQTLNNNLEIPSEIQTKEAISSDNDISKPKTSTIISSPPVEMYYKDGSKLIATLTDNNNNMHHPISNAKVIININGINYTRITNSNGQAILSLNLESGEYIANVIFEGCDFYHSASSISKINIKSTINGGDLTKYYKNSSQYYAKFSDNHGNPIVNQEVNFNINGVFYTRTTNSNGLAKLNINLNPGHYIITAHNPKTNEEKSNKVTVLPTISANSNLVKYYKNKKAYSVYLHNPNGSYSKYTNVSFNINGVFYTRTSDNTGYASLNINLNPGHYIITAIHNNCLVSNNITVKSTIESKDLEMNYKDGSVFKAFITDNQGKPVGAGENITFNINGVFYNKITNLNSIASLNINLNPGEYIITTYHNNTQIGNKILIHNITNTSKELNNEFTYEIAIPNYVNVTLPKVEAKNNYSVKLGEKGIVKLPKYQIFEVNNGLKKFTLTNYVIENKTSVLINDKYIFIPFGKDKLKTGKTIRIQKDSGILIHSNENYTYIKYYNKAERHIGQFGVTINKEGKIAERINYIENGEIRASILFNTTGFDEYGIKYNLALANNLNPENSLNLNYVKLTNNKINPIKFTSTNKTINLNSNRENIIGDITNEKINTIFKTKNNLIEKVETITYGTHPKYNSNNNFEILQSYAIINSKVTSQDIENLAFGLDYLTSYTLKHTQGMFLAGLNTAFLSDINADQYSKYYNTSWQRTKTAVILGGINNDKLYLHIANPNMGLDVSGKNTTQIAEFKFVNSLLLSKIEQMVMSPVGDIYNANITSSFDEIINGLLKSEVSFVNKGDLLYILCENGDKSALIINTTTGIAKTVLFDDEFAYKGVTQKTDNSECTICIIPKLFEEVLNDELKNLEKYIIAHLDNSIGNILKNIQPTIKLSYTIGNIVLKIIGGSIGGAASVIIFPATFAILFQQGANTYRTTYVDEKDTHYWYSHFSASKPGYFQDTKVFLIPKEDGTTDYVEVHINPDNSLNRSQAKYISKGNTRNLSVSETYKYFDEESWTPFNVPQKLWKT